MKITKSTREVVFVLFRLPFVPFVYVPDFLGKADSEFQQPSHVSTQAHLYVVVRNLSGQHVVHPLLPSQAFSLSTVSAPPGCMKTGTPRSCSLAQKGSNFGEESDSPSTCPPTEAPRWPNWLTARSTCAAAKSGNCSDGEVRATKRV